MKKKTKKIQKNKYHTQASKNKHTDRRPLFHLQ